MIYIIDFELLNIYSKSERDKAMKLVLKIFTNILNNPSEIGKYGNLNFNKINKKLSIAMYKPVLQSLFIAGSNEYTSDNIPRLIWMNTSSNTKENNQNF